ncbi:hypothetical protein BBD41_07170 [Paenibacillus ihbetae]|uniref:Uncharacterized protein n=1 Tax=Paenibacillus ihbetae TaxID=1870820 RepID=A0A1B2DXM4_9BACL|nr:hypothetical protein [Paenibacillus ihbetae]ANY72377.1 hypothetical protein BBD41_07170 [Paenibacillus ihbetae]
MGAPFKPYKLKFSTTDALILGAAVLFFPLAMVLAAIRMMASHRRNSCKGRNYRLLGWVLLITFMVLEFLMIIGSTDTGETGSLMEVTIFLGIVFLVPVVILFVIGNRRDQSFGMLIEVYTDTIVRRRLFHVPYIAQAVRQGPEQVIRDLNDLFRLHLLPYGRIENGVVKIPSLRSREDFSETSGAQSLDEQLNSVLNQAAVIMKAEKTETQEEDGPYWVECSGCGAKSSVARGEHKECDYCGTLLRHSRIG